MSLYDGLKDIAKVVQKADNIELYQKLLDLGTQALDLQNKVTKLQEENIELKKGREIENDIERHKGLFLTRKSDVEDLMYCSHCYDSEKKLVQVEVWDSGYFKCPHCKNQAKYDEEKAKRFNSTAFVSVPRTNRHSW